MQIAHGKTIRNKMTPAWMQKGYSLALPKGSESETNHAYNIINIISLIRIIQPSADQQHQSQARVCLSAANLITPSLPS